VSACAVIWTGAGTVVFMDYRKGWSLGKEHSLKTRFAISPERFRIAYDVSGRGPAIMLLHGGGGSRQEWHAGGYVARLKDDFKVITVDLRGHGESDKPTDPACYTTDKMGQDFLAVADACGVDKFILWGYSFGSNVGRYLAARSERVEKMIMVGSPLGPGVSGEWRQMALDFRARWAPSVQRQLGDGREGPFDPQLLPRKDQEEIQRLSFPGALVPVILAWSSAMLEWAVVRPADFRCPALWLFGSRNGNAMASYKKYEKSLKGSKIQVRIFEGFDHEQEFTQIDRVLSVILAFLC
jgi:pimeloyl-ACP methyl ester carboxylesterase